MLVWRKTARREQMVRVQRYEINQAKRLRIMRLRWRLFEASRKQVMVSLQEAASHFAVSFGKLGDSVRIFGDAYRRATERGE